VAIEVMQEMVCSGHASRSSASDRHEVGQACRLSSVEDPRVDQTHRLGMRLFVKNVPHLIIFGRARASVLPAGECIVFYKIAVGQPHVGDDVIPSEKRPGS
jgi:hypothetical protein